MAPSPKYATATPPVAAEREAGAGSRGDAAPDDAEAADQAVLRRGHVHGAGEAAVDPRRPAEHLVEQLLRVDAERERVPVAPVGGGDAVLFAEDAGEADGDRLLARVEMRRPVDLAAEEERLDEVLEAADEPHPPVQVEVELDVAERRGLDGARRGHAVVAVSGSRSTRYSQSRSNR